MGRIFYLDAVNGNDKNNGITPDEALKSLESANRLCLRRRQTAFEMWMCVEGNALPSWRWRSF